MATTQQLALQQLYVAYFNRPADPAGLAFYDANLTAGKVTMAEISADFAKSDEYQEEYDQATFAGVVTQVYTNLFGRPGTAEEKKFWIDALNSRATTIDKVVNDVAFGAQTTDKDAVAAKVAVAAAFTEALNTDAEKTAYNNEDAQAAAKAILATIKTADDAEAAIEDIDTHVAAVVEEGTPFTLESGLAGLAAAQEARADFLEAFGEENDIEDADEDSVEAAVTAAEADLVALIDDEDFAGASAGVKLAMIADQEETNADTLEAANKALKTATDATAKVTGLDSAIAAAASAEEGVEEAQEAGLDAMIAYQNAQTNFIARNPGATPPVPADPLDPIGSLTLKVGTVTVAEVVDGEVVVAEDIDASEYPGLTAFVTAANAAIAAQDDMMAAMEASMFAQLRVEMLDLETGSLTGAFDFTATTVADENKPTYNQIVNELSALTSKSVAADAAVAASTPANPGHGALVTAATNARTALNDFRTSITDFIEDNTTAKADAVTLAKEGTLAQAAAAVAEVDGLADAIAAQAALTAAQAALADAQDELTLADAALDADLTFDVTVGLFDDAGTPADDTDDILVAEVETDGTLTVVDATGYDGVEAYIAAYNDVVAAQEAVTDAAVDPADGLLLAGNTTLVTNYNAALTASQSTTLATRAAALGTEGAQAAIDALAEAQEALEAANAAADELASLDEAIEDAQGAFEDNEYAAPVMLESASAFGTTDSDIFVVTDTNATITNFGRAGDDVLFIGSGYTLNTGDFAEDGVDSALEVFFVQSGNNTIVTIETKAFGSNSNDAEIKITLTGVDADDLSFNNGIISI